MLASLVLFQCRIDLFYTWVTSDYVYWYSALLLMVEYYGKVILLKIPVTVNNFVQFTRFIAPFTCLFGIQNLFAIAHMSFKLFIFRVSHVMRLRKWVGQHSS